MKLSIGTLFCLLAIVIGCQQTNSNSQTASIQAKSMVCGSCAKNVEKAVKKVNGVSDVQVDIKAKMVEVKYDPAVTNVPALETAITNAGYDANVRKRNPEAYEKLDKCCKIDG